MRQCIINNKDEQVTALLTDMGYICHPVVRSNLASAPISWHSDVLYRKVSDNAFLISSCQRQNKPILERTGYSVQLYDGLQPGYKNECKLNFVFNRAVRIYNPATSLDISELTEKFKETEEITVKQGYTACSTVTVSDYAYITEDLGIYKALKNKNFDCLLIKKAA